MDKQLGSPWIYKKASDAVMYAEGAGYIIIHGPTTIAFHLGDTPGSEWYLTNVPGGFIWDRSRA